MLVIYLLTEFVYVDAEHTENRKNNCAEWLIQSLYIQWNIFLDVSKAVVHISLVLKKSMMCIEYQLCKCESLNSLEISYSSIQRNANQLLLASIALPLCFVIKRVGLHPIGTKALGVMLVGLGQAEPHKSRRT